VTRHFESVLNWIWPCCINTLNISRFTR